MASYNIIHRDLVDDPELRAMYYNRLVILFDLSGILIHNNRSLGSGNLPADYAAGDPEALRAAYNFGRLPKGYYCIHPEDVVWIDGALSALRRVAEAGLDSYIITNQEWIGCGILSDTADPIVSNAIWTRCMDYMDDQVKAAGGNISGWFYCPHAPNEFCFCRKRTDTPGAGLFYEAAAAGKFYLHNAWIIEDNPSGIVAAQNVGCKAIHIPLSSVEDYDKTSKAELTVESLKIAVDMLLCLQESMTKEGYNEKCKRGETCT